MPGAPDLRAVGSRIELLLAELRSAGDAATAGKAEELVRLLMEFYGAGLARVVELADEELLARLSGDELVASLLVVHDLHPRGTRERVVEALDRVRPYLGSHAGGVEFLGVDGDGVVRLRLEGSCDGCPSSTVTVSLAIERAIEEAAPEVTGVHVEGVTAARPAGARQLLQIQPLHRQPAAEAAPAGGWTEVEGLGGLRPGELAAVSVAGLAVAVCLVDGSLYAYRDHCPACGAALAGGGLAGTELACRGCGARFDVRLAGRGVDDPDLHLDPLPLLDRDGAVLVAVPAAVGP
jgi:Fe-S cluster biogenesis protein NfuA/nitrite reductase/ring-hydroxylating ferredoxin subunit